MRKILKTMFAFSFATIAPLSVVACGQATLDNKLNEINNGDTLFQWNDFKQDSPIKDNPELWIITQDQANAIAKKIAEEILQKDGEKEPIKWYDQTLPIGVRCYSYKVTNGTQLSDGKNLGFEITQTSETFDFSVDYQVGSSQSNKTFTPVQRISKTFKIQVRQSNDDKVLKAWIDEFNQESWKNQATPIEVAITKKEDFPNNNVSYKDLKPDAKIAVIDTITAKINWNGGNTVSFTVADSTNTISNSVLEMQLNANKGDSKGVTNNFYIKFISSNN